MPAKFQFIDYTSEYTIQLFTFTTVLNNEIQYCVERTAVFTQNRTIQKLTIVQWILDYYTPLVHKPYVNGVTLNQD